MCVCVCVLQVHAAGCVGVVEKKADEYKLEVDTRWTEVTTCTHTHARECRYAYVCMCVCVYVCMRVCVCVPGINQIDAFMCVDYE